MTGPTSALAALLFEAPFNTFAILDGASIPGLPAKLNELGPEHACLYRGPQGQDVLEVAPYLVLLRMAEPFTSWVLERGWGRHWGIFLLSKAALAPLSNHLRRFLLVRDPEGAQLYFRYYDPRVMRTYLPTCTEQELQAVFGPVWRYCMEGQTPDSALIFSEARPEPVIVPLSDRVAP